MKKKIILCALATLTVFALGKTAVASSMNISPSMPRSGGITLDDNGKIIAATDPSLLKGAPKARAAINFKDSRWVYYTEFWPDTAWSNKRANSNYNHYSKYHSSTAKVGENSRKKYAVANEYSNAAVTGKRKDTASMFYDY